MQPDLKSKFLQKKKQEKKKSAMQLKQKNKTLLLQKNIRAYLTRKYLRQDAIRSNNLEFSLVLSSDVSGFDQQTIRQYLHHIQQYDEFKRLNLYGKLVHALLKKGDGWQVTLAYEIIKLQEFALVKQLSKSQSFVIILQKLLINGKGCSFLEIFIRQLEWNKKLRKIAPQILLDVSLKQYSNNYLDVEGIDSSELKLQTNLLIFNHLASIPQKIEFTSQNFSSMCNFINRAFQAGKAILQCPEHKQGLGYCLKIIKNSLNVRYQDTISLLIHKNKQLLALIQDQQQMEYFEAKMRAQKQYVEFCDQTLSSLSRIFAYPERLHELMDSSHYFREKLSEIIADIYQIYDTHKVLWICSFLSDEKTLHSLIQEKNSEFYISLNMKMLTLDDKQFSDHPIFDRQQWKEIIHHAIFRGFQLNKMMATKGYKKKEENGKLVPFQFRDSVQKEIRTLAELTNNLYKKCLRTKIMNTDIFINDQLDKMMNSFTFGVGAKALESMIKSFPFAFRFETRYKKLKQFIKTDKLNYDRTLFLQEEIDEDLIITIRRGHEFLDAYHNCFYKDLRKKYKIIFFNEQGLEEEGIDGGGIIKEFINRILKSSFSEIFGMFYETQNNEVLPNPYSPSIQQYQFIGKVVGKAVYQGINIEYKFAQPFLNLLIGRQNSFEDLQYIDKHIYTSLVNIKRSDDDISELQQTFTILDQLPNGMKKIINLKNPSIQSKYEVAVTNDNKLEFVMSYADFKCNKQLQQKTRLFRKGFLRVMKSQWLSMFSNQQLNQIISGGHPNYDIEELKYNVILHGYNEKDQTILDLWSVLRQFTPEQKSLFLHYITSCPRPPTLGFATMKPLICLMKSQQKQYLPTANTCMNTLKLPDYKNRETLKKKLIYAINAKAGFQFA